MSEQIKENEFIISAMMRVCKDRASASCLKKYWSRETRHYSFPVLGNLGLRDPDGADARTVALYAIHPDHSPQSAGLGHALRKLDGGSGNMDSRVRRLLASDTIEDVTLQIRRLLPLLSRDGIGVNYNHLLWDLRKWNQSSEGVKTGWGRGYWMSEKEEHGEA
ncbi:MAG: type I-E CRISPR-associated protein Cse2/CasB [Terrimicrobiaceae bacterium]